MRHGDGGAMTHGTISLGIQSYLLRFGGTGVAARRVQSCLLRRYDWIPIGYVM